jgi:hypothetical protein
MRPKRCQVAASLLLAPALLRAGMCSPADGQPRHDFSFYGGYSPASTTLIGTETGRRFILAGFNYGYRCWIWNSVSLSYTAGAMPAAILLQPDQPLVPAHAVYGFAIAPLGFTLDLARRHRIHPFAEFLGGLIASTEPIPENQPDASGLNFMFDLGLGVRWNRISVGYKFLHISNADTTSFNPGVDNNIIYAGYSFSR